MTDRNAFGERPPNVGAGISLSDEPRCFQLSPSRSGRDINDGPVYAPDSTYACGDPDCYSCWPEGAPNTVGYSAGAVACPDEASARTHCDRATWVEPSRVDHHHQRDGQWIGCTYRLSMRRWTR